MTIDSSTNKVAKQITQETFAWYSTHSFVPSKYPRTKIVSMYFCAIGCTPNLLDICMHSRAPGFRLGTFAGADSFTVGVLVMGAVVGTDADGAAVGVGNDGNGRGSDGTGTATALVISFGNGVGSNVVVMALVAVVLSGPPVLLVITGNVSTL